MRQCDLPNELNLMRNISGAENGQEKTRKAIKDLKNIFSGVVKCIDADCFKESDY